MDDEIFQQLTAVIEGEMEAQAGVERPFGEMPELIADAILDHFDVRRKPSPPGPTE